VGDSQMSNLKYHYSDHYSTNKVKKDNLCI